MLIRKRAKSGAVISTQPYSGSGVDITACNAHSIYISGNNGTVAYKKGGQEWIDQAPKALAEPADAANGWDDGPVWIQTDVCEIIVTLTGNADVIVRSYVDGK